MEVDKSINIPLLPEVWRDRPEIIYEYLKRKPYYERLCMEVAFVLETELLERKVEYSSIKSRAKDLNSFLEKLERKQYTDPFPQIIDLAGVRVICLYPNDLEIIEDIIKKEFILLEKTDKRKLLAVDRIGYTALHYVVKLGEEFSGARYDGLKDLVCEVQVRTVLQDAWATIDHHLMYKKRSSVPEELRLRINKLSGILEVADKQFEKIRMERLAYIRELETTKSTRVFLNRTINLDSFKAFCERAFPDAVKETEIVYFNRILKWINFEQYKLLKDLNKVVKKARPVLDDVISELALLMESRGIKVDSWTNLARMHISLAVIDKAFRRASEASPGFITILEKYDGILEEINSRKGRGKKQKY